MSVCVCVCVCVCVFVCRSFSLRLTVFLPPLLKVQCLNLLDIRNPWGKVMERSGLRFEMFCLEVVYNRRAKKKKKNLADVALQNMVETTLPDGLETSGRRVYR